MTSNEPRLFLITPPITDGPGFVPVLEAALGACDIACVLLRIAPMDETTRLSTVGPLVGVVQRHGAACLVEDDPQLALHAETDGVQVAATDDRLDRALRSLKPTRIVGAGGLSTRDDAMTAGEAGVDYLMFGGPSDTESHAAVVERVAWWAEIFNVPCVGYAASLGGIADLVRAGADFVALCDAVFGDPRGPAEALREAAATISRMRDAA